MRILLPSLLLLVVGVPTVRADDQTPIAAKPTKAGEELQALTKELDAARKAFFEERNELAKKLKATRDEAERKEIQKKLEAWQEHFVTDVPIRKFGPRFLKFAEENAKDPAGVDALFQVLREEWSVGGGPNFKSTLWEKAIGVLEKEYVKVPGVKRLLPLLASVVAISADEASEKFVRSVLEKNPDRVTQARAAQALANAYQRAVTLANQLKDDKETRLGFEREYGKEAAEKVITKAEKTRQSQKELARLLKERYADIVPDLSVGWKAPEVLGRDLDGKEVKLSDLKGKVVVLDIWATWCGPCRAMIPHERAMVEKLKGKPFVLVSISVDTQKDTLTKFLDKESMPWTHWWNGAEGGIVEDWNVTYFPTIYVIDAKGVIRHKDQNGEFPGEKLEEAVNALLKEIK